MLRPALALALVVGMLLGPQSTRAGQPPEVEYRNDRLTLHAHEAPLAGILDEVKRQSGAEMRGEPTVASVTIDLDAVPLREALERLLGPRSFTLTYGENGTLKAIQLKGGPQAATVSPEDSKHAPAGRTRKEMWDGVGKVFNKGGEVPMSGRLGQVTAGFKGTEKNGYALLFRVAAGSQDRGLRREAWRAGIRALEADQEMRNALIAAVGAMDDTELTTFSRALAATTPDSAEDLAKLIARTSSTPELRTRARNVLQLLHQQRIAAQAAIP